MPAFFLSLFILSWFQLAVHILVGYPSQVTSQETFHIYTLRYALYYPTGSSVVLTRLPVSNSILQWFYWGIHWHVSIAMPGREDITKLFSDFTKVPMRLERRWSREVEGVRAELCSG